MAVDKLQHASGNSASTTSSGSVTDSDTALPLTSDTNFSAKSGEGMVIIDEGTATEELAYATTKAGSSLTIPLANRGLEGGSPQAHGPNVSVKGIFSAGMWNNLVDALITLVDKTTGLLDTTKVVDLATAQTLETKTLTSPVLTDKSSTGTDSGTETLINKTLTSPVLNTGVSGTAVLDEDAMGSDSATKLATQQSIKAYVDANSGATLLYKQSVVDNSLSVAISDYKDLTSVSISVGENPDGMTILVNFSAQLYKTGTGGRSILGIRVGGSADTAFDAGSDVWSAFGTGGVTTYNAPNVAGTWIVVLTAGAKTINLTMFSADAGTTNSRQQKLQVV